MKNISAYIRLMRPANIVTAIADILLGFAASGIIARYMDSNERFEIGSLPWLILSTTGLYGGGVVLNDVFDYQIDRVERPERPLPSGKASLEGAIAVGSLLLLVGVASAFQVSLLSGAIAIGVAFMAVLYDAVGKHHPFFGPLNMGLCRGGNLLLGISALPDSVEQKWFMVFIPVIYIAAITLISRGEVNGGDRKTSALTLILYAVVVLIILTLGILPMYNTLYSLPFLALFLYLTFPPLWKALKSNEALHIRRAVKAAVIALIILDATIAAGFGGALYGVVVAALLPVSVLLAKAFPVT